eukprot:12684799-Ditylum_brightwellii.AAC.2
MAVTYISQGEKRLAKSNKIKEKLEELEEANELEQKISIIRKNNKNNNNNKNNKKGDNNKNKEKVHAGDDTKKKGGDQKTASDNCRLLGHDHIVGQYSSNEEFMMTTKDNDSDGKLNKEIEGRSDSGTKDKITEKSMGHPETILALPMAPCPKKIKTVRCLLGICVTSSLMDPKFLMRSLGSTNRQSIL